MRVYWIILFLFIITILNANIFMDINAALSSVTNGSVAWADYDCDGDLDLLVTGRNDDLSPILRSRLFRNDNGSFNNTTMIIPGMDQTAVAWCDIDNDNDLDLVVTGNSSASGNPSPITNLYLNNNGNLVLTDMGLVPVSKGSVSWIDYDKDGYKDLIISGNASSTSTPSPFTAVYHNDHGFLNLTDISLEYVYESASMVFDFNADGWDDVLICGNTGNDNDPIASTTLYMNDNGTLVPFDTSLSAVRLPSLDWADYDRDGDPDIMLAGYSDESGTSITSIYNNNLSTFTALPSDFYPVSPSSITWGDYDIDGDMDLVFTGSTILGGILEPITSLYQNNDGSFLYIYDAPATVLNGMAAFGDYDNDQDLDIALTGEHPLCPGGPITRIYRNDVEAVNTPPSVPTNLQASFSNQAAFFSWDASTDDVTNQSSLTYNLRIGTTPGGTDVLSPMSDLASGRSYLPQKGNTRYTHTRKIPNLAEGIYYWSVQAMDDCYSASAFAPEQVFSTTSADDATASTVSMKTYPNPLQPRISDLNVKFTTPLDPPSGRGVSPSTFEIYNIKGQMVKSYIITPEQAKTGEISYNVHDLPTGVYICKFHDGIHFINHKITIIK
ncbi:MAG TPA: FG-GAP-like repeat-containing protein [Candidatus Cloacimonadota bacterium]|nr:FG-GAP-like repeat-containing protein [Candidatus Cloacimonadota bacterium]